MEKIMQEHGMYFGKQEYYDLIRTNGGTWNDSKERPLVCLMKSLENEHLYWAIPVGDWAHRTKEAQERIKKFLNYDTSDIRSCFYHLGSTDKQSIFLSVMSFPLRTSTLSVNTLADIPAKSTLSKTKLCSPN